MIKGKDRFFLLLVIGITALYFFYCTFCGIGTFADVLRGIEIIHQGRMGGQWNTLTYPSPHGSFSFFVAWWSPAQWIFISVLSTFFTSNFQLVQLILVGIFIPIGLFGYYKLSLNVGFSRRIALLSLLLISSNQLFYWNFILFYGGDLFVFAFLPYYLLLLLRIVQKQSFFQLFLFLLAALFFCFLKNTAVLFVIASIPFLFASLPKITLRNKAYMSAFVLGTSSLLATLFFLFFMQGNTPGQSNEWIGYNGIENSLLSDITYSLAAPVGVLSHLGSAVQKASPYLKSSYGSVIFTQVLLLFLSAVFFIFLFKNYKQNNPRLFLLVFTFILPVLLVFLYFYGFNKAVSYDARHFAAISFVLAPAFIEFIQQLKKFKRFALIALIGISVVDFAQFFVERHQFSHEHQSVEGIYVKNKEAVLLNTLSAWAKEHPSGLILINDRWIGVLGCRSNDKLVVRSIAHNKWVVVSGMELDNPPLVNLNRFVAKSHYSSILLVEKKGEENIVSSLCNLSFRKIGSNQENTFFEWKK